LSKADPKEARKGGWVADAIPCGHLATCIASRSIMPTPFHCSMPRL
jgi:hypothetical protein